MNKSKKLAYLQMSKKPPRPVTKESPVCRTYRLALAKFNTVDDPFFESIPEEDVKKAQAWIYELCRRLDMPQLPAHEEGE